MPFKTETRELLVGTKEIISSAMRGPLIFYNKVKRKNDLVARPVGSDSTLMLVGKFRTILEIHSHDCQGIERSKLYSAIRKKWTNQFFGINYLCIKVSFAFHDFQL